MSLVPLPRDGADFAVAPSLEVPPLPTAQVGGRGDQELVGGPVPALCRQVFSLGELVDVEYTLQLLLGELFGLGFLQRLVLQTEFLTSMSEGRFAAEVGLGLSLKKDQHR